MRKGFTLIELLVVIAIVAVLATVLVLVLNPAQLLAEARDGQRLGDITALRDGILLLLVSTTSSPNLGTTEWCNQTCGAGSPFIGAGTVRAVYTTNGSGWVPLDFAAVSGGSPFGVLPRDPTNNATYFYAYGSNTTTFELNARMESTKFLAATGPAQTDGGDQANWFEVGSLLTH